MNGEREATAGTGLADEQIFARPAWLEDFGADAAAGRAALGRVRDDEDDDRAPGRRTRRDDDDFWDDPEPSGWRSTVDRVRTTPRAAVALVVVGVIAAVVAAVVVFGPAREGGTGEYPVVDFAGASASVEPSAPTPPSAAPPSAAAPSAAPAELVVAVVGLVRAPGLHRLRPGARVADALTAARGALGGADTTNLNLAQPLRDGDQVVVGAVDPKAGVTPRSSVTSGSAPGAASSSGAPGTGAAAAAGTGSVNINTASAAELDRLPGVGAATAAAIIAYREQNGPFRSVDDLGKVSGIGDAKLAKIKPMATV
ncbi:competence protein ComEA [Tsukamurella pulmonis]|uniref:Competence protein ComEA n=1 Tax=Tsukamurella pulmonis TaxID=47312 RepID=A0A1H1GB08_9ACTN|nr:ComEA family DNA-binding protein [Tsukamurella pulmonis]SDR10036.1 competence protein ComEA [Tsukamurella pulmonis]SUP17590.1 ComE operon protein 1 [Tsukamurella pulmonis]